MLLFACSPASAHCCCLGLPRCRSLALSASMSQSKQPKSPKLCRCSAAVSGGDSRPCSTPSCLHAQKLCGTLCSGLRGPCRRRRGRDGGACSSRLSADTGAAAADGPGGHREGLGLVRPHFQGLMDPRVCARPLLGARAQHTTAVSFARSHAAPAPMRLPGGGAAIAACRRTSRTAVQVLLRGISRPHINVGAALA